MARASSRTRIVAAAERVVARDGGGNLTLDAVAKEAGVSKGGLLYHFPSKEALLQAILEAHVLAKLAALEEQRQKCSSGGEHCTYLEAHIRATESMLCADAANREVGVALIAAIANNPDLLRPMRDKFDDVSDRIWGKRSAFEPDAAILWLASEGLRFFAVLNHDPFLPGQREWLMERMLERQRALRADPARAEVATDPSSPRE
jgi:AcrR family transcriptional regulator